MMEEEGEDVCRVCRSGPTPGNPLSYPCKCNGSIKFIHQGCLLDWIKFSKSSACELCGHPFRFTPIYSENAPDVLPAKEFILEAVIRLSTFSKKVARVLYVMVCYMLLVPLFTGWSSSVIFYQKLPEISTADIPSMIRNFFIGFMLFFWITIITISSYLVFDLLEHKHSELDMEESITAGGDANARRNNQNSNDEADDSSEEEDEASVNDTTDDSSSEDDAQEPLIDHLHQQQAQDQQFQFVDLFRPRQAPLPPQQVANAVNNDQDADHMDLRTLIGLSGPKMEVIAKGVCLIIYNSIFMIVFFLLPYTYGRAFIQLLTTFLNFELPASTSTKYMIHLGIGYIITIIPLLLILRNFIANKIHYNPSRLLFSFIKISAIVLLEIGIIPLLFGSFIDYISTDLYGGVFYTKIKSSLYLMLPFILTRWGAGIFCIINISSLCVVLHQVLRRKFIWFLRDPVDPELDPIKDLVKISLFKHLINIVLSLLIYCLLVVLLLFLPLKLLSIFPGLLPYNIGDPLEKSVYSHDLIFFIAALYFPKFHPQFSLFSFVKHFNTYFAKKCGIDEYILLPPRSNNNQQQQQQQQQNNQDPDQQQQQQQQQDRDPQEFPDVKPTHYKLRIIGFLTMWWLLLFNIVCFFLMVPVTAGRILAALLSISNPNDLLTFIAGIAILWASTKLLYLTTCRRPTISIKWIPMALKVLVIGFSIGVFLPILIGFLFDLILFIPFVTAVDETFYVFTSDLFYCWCIGALIFKFWHKLVTNMPTRRNIRHNNIEDDPEGQRDGWYDRFETLKRNGFANVDLGYSMTKIVFPIAHFLMILFSVPYFVSRGLVPWFGGSDVLSNFLFRFGYPTFALFLLIENLYNKTKGYFVKLHNKIRDDRYLIGKHLHNIETRN